MKTKKEIYIVVFGAVTKEASKTDSRVIEGHRNFAKVLPDPQNISEEEAATFSAKVVSSPSNDWGLEGFFQIMLPSGERLGDFVRGNLPDYNQYYNRMEMIAKKYISVRR